MKKDQRIEDEYMSVYMMWEKAGIQIPSEFPQPADFNGMSTFKKAVNAKRFFTETVVRDVAKDGGRDLMRIALVHACAMAAKGGKEDVQG